MLMQLKRGPRLTRSVKNWPWIWAPNVAATFLQVTHLLVTFCITCPPPKTRNLWDSEADTKVGPPCIRWECSVWRSEKASLAFRSLLPTQSTSWLSMKGWSVRILLLWQTPLPFVRSVMSCLSCWASCHQRLSAFAVSSKKEQDW